MCSDHPRPHCLLPPHGVEDCIFSSSFLCSCLRSRPSPIFFHFLAWHCALLAPDFRCHQEIFAALGASTCAGSRAWNFSSSPFFSVVLFRLFMFADRHRTALNWEFEHIQTAYVEFPFCFAHIAFLVFSIYVTSICDAPWLSLKSVIDCAFGIRLCALERHRLLLHTRSSHCIGKAYWNQHSSENPHVWVENVSNELSVEFDVAQRHCMRACDALGVCPCWILSFLATYHLDDGMDMSAKTVLDSNLWDVLSSC